MKLSISDHNFCLKACADPRATAEEQNFLSFMASMHAAGEQVSHEDYSRMQELTGGYLSLTTPIFQRPKKV